MKKSILLLTGSLFTVLVLGQDAFNKGNLIGSENFGPERAMINMSFWPMEGNTPPRSIYAFNAADFNAYCEYGISNYIGIGLIGNFENFYFSERQPYITDMPLVSNANVAAMWNLHLLRSRRYDLFLGIDYGFSQISYFISAQNANVAGSGTWGDSHIGGRVFFGQLGVEIYTAVSMADYRSLSSDKPVPGEYIPSKWSDIGYNANIGLCYKVF